MLGDDVT
jgi:hypothetical protein